MAEAGVTKKVLAYALKSLMASRPLSKITVGDILRALEGGLTLLDCLDEEDACGKSCDCPSRKIWQRLRDGINEIVDGITLDDMLRRDE